MFRPTSCLWQATVLTADLLKSQLPQKWFGGVAGPHVGLAVSGGVDSMALATLCGKLRDEHGDKAPYFTAFIVDHGLRAESREEALQVSKFLKGLDVASKILILDWQEHGGTGKVANLESAARRLRYRAMGEACRRQDIDSLLFAHHADDQAETTLMRLANNYLGSGLAGMRREARIPECEDVYGVSESGTPRKLSTGSQLLVESGGVLVHRPLLSYTKGQLIATCKQAGVDWVEDHTNKDPSLTLRNTVRQLHEDGRLPQALQRPRLLALAAATLEQNAQVEEQASRIFASISIRLRPESGSATCLVDEGQAQEVNSLPESDRIKAVLLRKLLLLVAPARHIDLATLQAATQKFLARAEEEPGSTASTFVFAGASLTPLQGVVGGLGYQVHRVPPKRGNRPEVKISLSSSSMRGQEPSPAPIGVQKPPRDEIQTHEWSRWQLWDERYWIRIGALPADYPKPLDVVVRMLTAADIATLRRETRSDDANGEFFSERLSTVDANVRQTLPAIVQLLPDGEGSETCVQRIVALPTLSWGRDGWFPRSREDIQLHGRRSCHYYDIRYKHIDDSLTQAVDEADRVDWYEPEG